VDDISSAQTLGLGICDPPSLAKTAYVENAIVNVANSVVFEAMVSRTS
jgi:hypothetical protein